jgi:hypothetical protein
MESTVKKSEKERCIHCGAKTPYFIDTPVNLRNYYIDGAGQLCKKCFEKIYN